MSVEGDDLRTVDEDPDCDNVPEVGRKDPLAERYYLVRANLDRCENDDRIAAVLRDRGGA